jgi:hypothetical protein
MKVTKMQLYRLIYFSLSALHVSGDVFVHYQEHLTVFTVSGSVHLGCYTHTHTHTQSGPKQCIHTITKKILLYNRNYRIYTKAKLI